MDTKNSFDYPSKGMCLKKSSNFRHVVFKLFWNQVKMYV